MVAQPCTVNYDVGGKSISKAAPRSLSIIKIVAETSTAFAYFFVDENKMQICAMKARERLWIMLPMFSLEAFPKIPCLVMHAGCERKIL